MSLRKGRKPKIRVDPPKGNLLVLAEGFTDGVREYGEDDWVQFIDIGHLLIEETGSNTDLIARGAEAAAELVKRGVMVPGDLTDDGFVSWSVSAREAADHIKHRSEQLAERRRIFRPGDICWFQTDNYDG